MNIPKISETKIVIIGLGYVGLPLAVEFSKKLPVIGYDINESRISELKNGIDHTLESSTEDLRAAEKLTFTSNSEDLRAANVYIVTTPTPIDEFKKPDLTIIRAATRTLAQTVNPGDIIIYESTVYPGVTEEECVPIIEEVSGLKFNEDFFAGYSPERINPGDKVHRLPSIVKVTSGSTPEIADFVDELYNLIITAGTHRASSIKVAEAAKVIENTQRDVNIALINELAILFNKMNIDTEDVLEAAGTKWNFLPFRPGLVGGHCIGVDPYYLTHKAQAVGHNPEIILAGRRLNDSMGEYIASQLVKSMLRKSKKIQNARVLILGLTFKENTPDIRNTRVVDIITELEDYGIQVDVYDPWANATEVKREYGIDLVEKLEKNYYDAIIFAVAHEQFTKMDPSEIRELCKGESIVYDLKYVLPRDSSDIRL